MPPHRRTVAEIQRKVAKQRQRHPVCRLFHAKNDKDKIAAWKLDLNRILLIFHVHSVTSPLASLTILFQTELAIDTNVEVTGVRHDVSKARKIVSDTQNIVSNTQNVVSDTHNIVSEIHRAIVEHQGVSGGENVPVSNRHPLLITE